MVAEVIWCIIVVDDMGLLGLTQQLASTACDERSGTKSPDLRTEAGKQNPFGAGLSFHSPAIQNSAVAISSLSCESGFITVCYRKRVGGDKAGGRRVQD